MKEIINKLGEVNSQEGCDYKVVHFLDENSTSAIIISPSEPNIKIEHVIYDQSLEVLKEKVLDYLESKIIKSPKYEYRVETPFWNVYYNGSNSLKEIINKIDELQSPGNYEGEGFFCSIKTDTNGFKKRIKLLYKCHFLMELDWMPENDFESTFSKGDYTIFLELDEENKIKIEFEVENDDEYHLSTKIINWNDELILQINERTEEN